VEIEKNRGPDSAGVHILFRVVPRHSIDPDFWRSLYLRRTSAARFGSCFGRAEEAKEEVAKATPHRLKPVENH
jgi:hypothetical protein